MEPMQNKKVAVLGYHKIGNPPPEGWETWSYVPAVVFEEQLEYIKNNGWAVLSIEQFLSAINNPNEFPAKSILLTFDDGYQSNLEIAVPILNKYNYPAVMFVPTAYVGGYNSYDADIFYEPKENICTWEELMEIEQAGISVQSHGINHPHYSEISNHEIENEIKVSKQDLEGQLHKKIKAFAFPYGDNGNDADFMDKVLEKSGYKAAFLYDGGLMDINSRQPFRISRIPVGPDTALITELGEAV